MPRATTKPYFRVGVFVRGSHYCVVLYIPWGRILDAGVRMGISLSFSLSRSRTAQKYAADDDGNADGAVASSQSASLADTRLLLVPSTARNEPATSTSLMGAVEGYASSGGRGTRDLVTCASLPCSLPVSVPSPSSRFRRAQSDSQQEIGQLNELEESVSPSHSQASLPAHIEKCLTGLVACPSNALSRKVSF
jgi:hypothetical protein